MTRRRKVAVAVVEPSGIHMFDILGSPVRWKRYMADAVTPDYVGAGTLLEREPAEPQPAPTTSRRKAARRGR